MQSLSEIIELHKASKNVPALEKVREEIGEVVLFTQERVAEMVAQKKPSHQITQSQRNLNQAESNWVLVQNAVDSILNSK